MEEKFLYVVSDFNDYVYVVRATSRENAMDLVNYHTGQDKEDWIVNAADNYDGKIIEWEMTISFYDSEVIIWK